MACCKVWLFLAQPVRSAQSMREELHAPFFMLEWEHNAEVEA